MEPVAVPVDVAGDFERFYRSSYPGRCGRPGAVTGRTEREPFPPSSPAETSTG